MPELLPDANGVAPSEAEHNADIAKASTFDEAALVEKVSGKLADILDDGYDDEYDDVDQDNEDTDVLDDADPADDGSAADDASEDLGGDDADQDTRQSDAPTISTAHERSLAASHTPEEVQTLQQNLGDEGFADYAARIHEKRNAETARMAELGRMAQALQPQGQLPASESGAVAPSAQPTGATAITPIDPEALRAQFGDDELISQLVPQLNAQAAALNAMMLSQQQQQEQVARNEQESLIRQIDEFFGAKDLAAYSDHYGTAAASLTAEQQGSRTEVLKMADALMAGAQFQGRSLTIGEALAASHDALSVEVTEARVRAGLQKKAKTRNRGLTHKPSRKGSRTPDLARKGAPRNDREMEARTRQRMKQVFG